LVQKKYAKHIGGIEEKGRKASSVSKESKRRGLRQSNIGKERNRELLVGARAPTAPGPSSPSPHQLFFFFFLLRLFFVFFLITFFNL
jgi:hypothetical protein